MRSGIASPPPVNVAGRTFVAHGVHDDEVLRLEITPSRLMPSTPPSTTSTLSGNSYSFRSCGHPDAEPVIGKRIEPIPRIMISGNKLIERAVRVRRQRRLLVG